jgi:hypothetical protein
MSLDHCSGVFGESLLSQLLQRGESADLSGNVPRGKSVGAALKLAESVHSAQHCSSCGQGFDKLRVFVTADSASALFGDLGSVWLTNALNRAAQPGQPIVEIVPVAKEQA